MVAHINTGRTTLVAGLLPLILWAPSSLAVAAADSRPSTLEIAAQRVSEAVATGEVIAAAKGTLKQQGDKVPPMRAACLSALEPRTVANRIGYPLAEDFSRDEFLALTRFLDTPEGKRIQQARAERLASGNLVFRLTPEESAVVGKALPAPLAAKWSAGAATQPNTLQAMRKVFEEQQGSTNRSSRRSLKRTGIG